MSLSGFFTALPWAAAIILFSVVWIGILWMRKDTLKRGQLEEKNNTQAEALNDLQKAKGVADRVDNMPADDLERVRTELNRRS